MNFFSHVVQTLIEIRHLAARWHIEGSRAALTDRSPLPPTMRRRAQHALLDIAKFSRTGEFHQRPIDGAIPQIECRSGTFHGLAALLACGKFGSNELQ